MAYMMRTVVKCTPPRGSKVTFRRAVDLSGTPESEIIERVGQVWDGAPGRSVWVVVEGVGTFRVLTSDCTVVTEGASW